MAMARRSLAVLLVEFSPGGPFPSAVESKMPKLRLALIQLKTTSNKSQNIARALELVATAAAGHTAKVIALPEFFNSPYGVQYFAKNAERIPGPTSDALSAAAKKHGVYLVGGSIPEVNSSKLYNTSTVFGPDGSLLAIHRKLHLFDADLPSKASFRESDNFAVGSAFTTFDADGCRIGVAVCHDICFPELAMCYAELGCQLIIYPCAFEMVTGQAHWKLRQQSRALDNQLYVAGVSPARDESSCWVTWGHSAIVGPWGNVVVEADETEQIICAEIDTLAVEQVRDQVPIRRQKRHDIYRLESPLLGTAVESEARRAK